MVRSGRLDTCRAGDRPGYRPACGRAWFNRTGVTRTGGAPRLMVDDRRCPRTASRDRHIASCHVGPCPGADCLPGWETSRGRRILPEPDHVKRPEPEHPPRRPASAGRRQCDCLPGRLSGAPDWDGRDSARSSAGPGNLSAARSTGYARRTSGADQVGSARDLYNETGQERRRHAPSQKSHSYWQERINAVAIRSRTVSLAAAAALSVVAMTARTASPNPSPA